MMNSPVLDVAIGLVFIFLLYSLLATTIKEMVATIFSYRPRMLETALERMLDGDKQSIYWWNKLANFGIWFFNIGAPKKGEYEKEKKPALKTFMSTARIHDSPIKRGSRMQKKSSFFAASFVNHPLYKRAAEDTLLSKKPAYLAPETFSDILIDLLSPGHGKPILLIDIKNKISHTPALNEQTKNILYLYIHQANGDLQRFKLLLEDWYNDMMKRVTGWYKRQAYKILFIIGLVLAAGFNVDTVTIVHKLSSDKSAREELVKSASEYVRQNNRPANNPPAPGPANSKIDTAKMGKDLRQLTALYNKQIAQQNTTLALGWAPQLERYKAWQKSMGYQDAWYDDFWYAVQRLPGKMIGFLITALAISLGAPFWFDLLNKFINLRVSGKKPDDDNSAVSRTATLNQKPLPNSFG